MSTPKERKEIYNTPRWKRLRRLVMREAGWLCEVCQPRTVGATEVHHIKPMKSGGPAWAIENLQAICHRCHEDSHVVMRDPERDAWAARVKELAERPAS